MHHRQRLLLRLIATWGALPLLLACVEKASPEGTHEAPATADSEPSGSALDDAEPVASATDDTDPSASVRASTAPSSAASDGGTGAGAGTGTGGAGTGGVGAGGTGATGDSGGAGGTGAPPPNGGGGADAAADDDAAFEPAWLPNVSLDGVGGVLTLFASTLKRGAGGLELYAAIRNEGDAPLCGAAMTLEFYDQAEQLIGMASTGVQTDRLYRLPDGSAMIYCVAPGQTAMAAATSLPEGLVIEDLKYIGHRFPAFQIDDAEPLQGATVGGVEPYRTVSGTAYRGTVSNASDAPISDPSVAVFPVNAAGRPLGMATSTGTVEIAPGDVWSFETSTVAERGVDQLAFATASVASP